MSYKTSVSILTIIVLMIGAVFFINYKNLYSTKVEVSTIGSNVDTAPQPQPVHMIPDNDVRINSTQPISYTYLFEEKRELNTSNVVGYFAGGAFGWYVPDWLMNTHWSIKDKNLSYGGMIISPKEEIKSRPFSDIVMLVGTSTEAFNANYLYESERKIASSSVTINEIVLSKHTEGGISLVMEENTWIYHVQKVSDGRVMDFYYMDGNGQTLKITFDADESVYSQFSAKIRNLVEGIGEIKQIQG